ncbi:SidA/IucD/PvdA family monooxygenase [Simiduia sp. 21SJ11W-1]|uniref:lysine N(6)-hydroxylase/L-ornithine N(5)-oxygenase family protein n=1 Tax=Simiduia sp. 21SJ11W-1 TaxID=2909669 RepID=UPI00209CE63F|nr:SidA/IucD/PvdA family monooxygenase [Simiduia sp. 21SJ11W-1]UTA48964.1 SidA/IucD/PvdA family monooxygenase [Simiduia sp. 21SJ11W-1]
MQPHVYDVIGIGLGPFNLGLACLSSTLTELDCLFLERKPEFSWHPGLMLEAAHLQTPFMADLVTMADPTHPLSFLNYIKQQGRLYAFYIRENFFLMRREFNQYCQWAATQLNNVVYNQEAEEITWDDQHQCYRVQAQHPISQKSTVYFARRLVFGTGPVANLPAPCARARERVIHSQDYLFKKHELQKQRSITLVGSGQSAAEIFYDLLQDIDSKGYQLNWITRSPRIFPLEYTKITLEMTSPDYVDYFYNLPAPTRAKLLTQQHGLYKGINSELINAIYDLMYIKQLNGPLDARITTNASLQQVQDLPGALKLRFLQQEQEQTFEIDTQFVVMATGYKYRLPEFIHGIQNLINWEAPGRFAVDRHYSIDDRKTLFVQNAELHSHGFAAPDLGMACYRNSCILREILGYAPYPIEERIAFQTFAANSEGVRSFTYAQPGCEVRA